MKIILIALLLVFIAGISYAGDKPIAPALEWWLRGQDKFVGSSVSTAQDKDGKYVVIGWKVDGVEQPTDKDLEKIVSDYEKLPKPKTLEERIADLEKKNV